MPDGTLTDSAILAPTNVEHSLANCPTDPRQEYKSPPAIVSKPQKLLARGYAHLNGIDMQQRNTISRVAGDAVWTIASSLFLTFSGLGLNIMVGNWFGEAGLGIYSLVTAIYLFASNLTAIGQPVALTTHTAQYSDKPEVGRQFYTAALIFVSLTGPVAGITLFLLRNWLSQVFDIPELSHLLVAIALAVPLFLLNKVAVGRLNGLRQMRAIAVAESLRCVFLLVLTGGGVALAPGQLRVAVWALLGTEVLLLPFYWRLTRLLKSLSTARLKHRLMQLGAFGSQILLSRIIAELNVRLDLLLAGFFLTPREIGVYATALMFAQGIGILSVAIQKVTTPIMAELFARDKIPELEHFVNRTMQVVALFLVPLVIIMIEFFPVIVGVVYPSKPAFLDAHVPLIIMSTGFLLRGIVVPVSSIYLSCGRPDVEYKLAVIFLVVNATMALALVGKWRMNGIAMAASAKAVSEFILYTALARRAARVRIHYKPLLGMVLFAMLMIAVVSLIDFGIWSALLSFGLLLGFSLVAFRKLSLARYLVQLCPAFLQFKSE